MHFAVAFCIFLIALQPFRIGSESLKPDISAVRSHEESRENKIVIAVNGDSIKLQCEFSVDGWAFVRWIKLGAENAGSAENVESEEVASDSVLISSTTLDNLVNEDAGNYSCIKTSLSGSDSFKFTVVIKDKKFCQDGRCSPNGQCIELLNGYSCVCDQGFVGKHCLIADPCLNLPCQNNGSCSVVDEEFNCTCKEGYSGRLCENEVCTNRTCGPGGSCNKVDGKIKCTCSRERAGNRCQHQCTFSSRPCYSISTCLIREGANGTSESCRCDHNRQQRYYDYRDNRCMMESDVRNECSDPNICSRAGRCYDQIYQYRCNCNGYRSGKNCEKFNECGSRQHNLCYSNGGTCVDLVKGYKCTNCPSGQSGDKCQYKKDPCKVTCYKTKMVAECDMRFLDMKMRSIPIFLNSKKCRFRQNEQTNSYYRRYNNYMRRRMDISYERCGTEIEINDEYITYRNRLRAGAPDEMSEETDSIITRASGHFSFKMECRISLRQNGSEEMTDQSLALNETKDLEDTKDIDFGNTRIEFYDESYRNTISSYVVGDRLYGKISLDDDDNPTLAEGYQLHPVTCIATPSRNNSYDEKYFLLRNGCILDKTFELLERGNGSVSFFKFDSFSFKSHPGKLYIQCTSRLCVEGSDDDVDESCKPKCNDTPQEIESTTGIPLVSTTSVMSQISAQSEVIRSSVEN